MFLTHQQAIERFAQEYPHGFRDPNYSGAASGGGRQRICQACTLWQESLNEATFQQLIAAGEFVEIAKRASVVEYTTKLVHPRERSAVWNAVQDARCARDFSLSLYDLIYGSDPFQERFVRYASMLTALPSSTRPPLTWPMQSFFPFVAHPRKHLLLRPRVAIRAARRRQFNLNYLPAPNWSTYSRHLELGALLMQDLVAFNPQDMIDIQFFIFFTGRLAET